MEAHIQDNFSKAGSPSVRVTDGLVEAAAWRQAAILTVYTAGPYCRGKLKMSNQVVALTDLKIVFKVAAITYFTVIVNLDRQAVLTYSAHRVV